MPGSKREMPSVAPLNGASLDKMLTVSLGVIMFHNLRVNVLARSNLTNQSGRQDEANLIGLPFRLQFKVVWELLKQSRGCCALGQQLFVV